MNNRGFTLIEAIVSIAIFIAVSSTLAEIIVISIQNQIKITATQKMFTEAALSLDKMEKELRMAKKDATGICVGTPSKNYNVDGDSITFLYNDQETGLYTCKKYTLENKRIKEYISINDTSEGLPTSGIDVTSSAISIDYLNFEVKNDVLNDFLQPKITIALTVSPKDIENQAPIKFQTTISQRRLDL